MPHPARWLAFGGGAEPTSNQLSMESDLAAATMLLGPGGVLLFAGGPDSDGVYELANGAPRDPLLGLLGEVVSPHGGRDARYRKTRLAPHGPATREAILDVLHRELHAPGSPLPIVVASHGDGAAAPRDNSLATWGGDALTVREVAEALDGGSRPVRLLVSACFSGGFAELAFVGANPELGASPQDRCGLFASTWDLESTGCDPDPDRRSHEGYSLHFLHALRGQDREGKPTTVDLDGDGAISLLEAHTRARIDSRGLDVPTTTSERWLRHAAPTGGPSAPLDGELVEDEATVAGLVAALGLPLERSRAEEGARRRYEELEQGMDELADREDRTHAALEAARRAVRGELLARYPALEDPWHPDFGRTLAEARPELSMLVSEGPSYARYLRAREAADAAADASLELALKRAPYERLVRAFDDLALAARLKHRGGEGWDRYLKFLACERSRLR
jgi:hypothetical protein